MTVNMSREEFDRVLTEHSIQMGHAVEGVTDVAKAINDLYQYRSPSLAGAIGGGRYAGHSGGPYEPGSFVKALLSLNDRAGPERAVAAKATLEALGSRWSDVPVDSKATLGDTAAAGGWIVPNAVVAPIEKPAKFGSPFRDLCTVVPGVSAPSVDLPWRSAAPARAVVSLFGQTKENVNLVYDGYTATMYTLARIYDLGKQFVRQSAGAAEADVMGELASAFNRGETHYVLNGTGTNEPYGLVTALATAPGFTSSFTAATTLAGSILAAISTAAGALANRERTPEAAILNAATFWQMTRQGADAAGFYIAGANGPVSIPGIRPGTVLTPFGIPVIPISSVPTDDLIVGEFSALKMFIGESFRVDTSDQAGDRWDKNLVGFRGEMELGLDARPAVFAGAFEYVADVTP